MAVLAVTPRWSDNDLVSHSDDGVDYTVNRTLSWDVFFDAGDDLAVALLHPLIPIVRQSYPGNIYLRCTDVQPKQVSVNRAIVTAQYAGNFNFSASGSPLDLPPEISWGSVVSEEDIDEDINGKPLVTIVGEGFDPPVRKPIYDLVLRVVRNVADFNPSQTRLYANGVNSDVFLGQPVGTARLTIFEGTSVNDTDFSYWKRTTEVIFRRGAPRTTDAKAWYHRQLAQGFYYKDGAGNVVRAMDKSKPPQPMTVPVLHDITTGALITNPAMAQWYEFPIFESKKFADLNLP